MPPRQAVVVLGFHRSGTSMVTRMLNLLGVDLGDEGALLAPEERDNARGYWEPRWMIELNEELLAALGSGTFEPFRPEPGWERSPALAPLRERAQALLAEHFADRSLWGWKDPRTSLTLPFWRELVDAPLRCVVCVRNPADAVSSALKRGVPGIDRWGYAERWLEYTSGALEATAPGERLLVFYEDALRDPGGEARRLAAFLGSEEPGDDALAPVVGSVDPELRHHRSSAWDVVVDAGLPLEARTLYLALRARRRLTDGADRDGERLADALERAGQLQRDARSELLETGGRADAAAERADEAEARVAELRERLAESERQAEQLARERAGLSSQVDELRSALGARDAALAAVTGSRSWRMTEPLRRAGRRLQAR